VAFLLDNAPPGLHLVIATRADPPLPLSRWRARGQMVELRADDLRFTAEETAVLLNQVMALNLSAEEIAALAARTEGWIAGLQLATLSLRGQSTERVSQLIQAFSGSHHYILDYLLEEILEQQDRPEDHQQEPDGETEAPLLLSRGVLRRGRALGLGCVGAHASSPRRRASRRLRRASRRFSASR
jgi:ATP/maltotriose-dependent transcriptional regulator MalT